MLRNTDIPCAANVAQQTAWRTADTGWLACSEQHADALAVQANRRISSSIDVISLLLAVKEIRIIIPPRVSSAPACRTLFLQRFEII